MPASDRAYPSVWAKPRRKERSTLTREQIVRQALELLDTEGIDALSMRKLAARLEAGTTSLYWHVANRDELIELVVDEIYGELEAPEEGAFSADWQDDVRRYAHSVRASVLRHPWVVAVLDHLVAGYPGPNAQALAERMLGVFAGAGFDIAEAERAFGTLSSFLIGTAMAEAAWTNWLARRGQTVEEWTAESMRAAADTPEEHERLHAVLANYEGKDAQQSVDEDFTYGLDRVLDGLQARLDAR